MNWHICDVHAMLTPVEKKKGMSARLEWGVWQAGLGVGWWWQPSI